ncbi:MAG: 16S rRNA (guanine(966)-N(2))-methyltransferase RsmD [Kiritimatiellales bacterium]|nr:16S rRNA (guanine(966)-N(2))-methyltransferase RsmD [Kiritimatiellales bacterium]
MKITSGILRNRRFNVPKQEVRPTKGLVREAVFSSLGGSCEGLRVLDLFAGSGGLGLEAWSRGAESVTFVEQSFNVWKNLQENVQSLDSDGLGSAKCIKADAFKYLAREAGERFNLIFADPPYDLPDALEKTLNSIREHSTLSADGIVVYELRSSDPFELSKGWNPIKEKVYGDTRILMLGLNEGDDYE